MTEPKRPFDYTGRWRVREAKYDGWRMDAWDSTGIRRVEHSYTKQPLIDLAREDIAGCGWRTIEQAFAEADRERAFAVLRNANAPKFEFFGMTYYAGPSIETAKLAVRKYDELLLAQQQLAELEHVKSLLARARSVMRGDAWDPADFDALTDAIDQALAEGQQP